jgi:flagellar biosynthesis/type III secretory pathway protein FliH
LEAEENLHTAAQTLGTALEQISLLRKSMLLKSKEDMLRLIMAMARQVIHTEIEEKKDVILQTLTKTLQAAIQSDKYYKSKS